MYQEAEMAAVNAQLRRRWILFLIPCLALLACQIFGIIHRNQILTSFAGAVLLAVFLFVFEMLILPLYRYRHFLHEMLYGPRHDIEGDYLSTESDDSVIEGVTFRGLHFTCLDDNQDPYDRLFYLDRTKPLPQLNEGQHVTVTFHDRQIVAIRT